MTPAPDRSFRYLFRTDRGRIDRATWWCGTLPLVALGAIMTGGWLLIRPFAHHDLATTPFLAIPTVAAFLYLAIFTFALILIAICEYNLSAKRFRDRGRAAAMAAVLPMAIFLTSTLIWFIPQSFGEVPDWTGPVALLMVSIVVVWNVWDLGFGESRRSDP